MAKLGGIAPYFGSKRALAPKIVQAIGTHSVYWGLCHGSLAVELAKPRVRQETCVDLHGDVSNLALVLADPDLCEKLYRYAASTPMSDAVHSQAYVRLQEEQPPRADSPCAKRAALYLIVSWQGRNGFSGTEKEGRGFAVRYTSGGGAPATRWSAVIDSIPLWHQRLLGMTFLRRDMFEVLQKVEDKRGVVVYVDPPYIDKGAKYIHDFTPRMHSRMAHALSRFTLTRVVVSYYDHPWVRKTYTKRWNITDLSTCKNLANASGKRATAPEIILTLN